jgi:tetratricopeptide (TPR) repeat protein
MPALTVQRAFDLALQQHQAGKLAEAEALYRQILNAQPGHAEALHMIGVLAIQSGRFDIAVEWIQRALALDATNPASYSNLGEAYRQSGRLREALTSYERALTLKAEFPVAQYNLGLTLAALGRFDEALASFDRTLELQPDNAAVHVSRAKVLQRLDRLNEAAAAYRRALAMQPGSAETWNDLGIALSAKGDFAVAVDAFQRALERQPAYAEASNNLGNALQAEKRFDEAIAAYRRALGIKSDFAAAQKNLGHVLLKAGRSDEAIAAFGRVLQIQPGWAEADVNIGLAHRNKGDLQNAVAAFQRALQIHSENIELHALLGTTMMAQGHVRGAIEVFQRALEINPQHAETHLNLGNALVAEGRFEEAATEYRKSSELRPEHGAPKVSLAILHLLRGEFEVGWQLYEARLELHRSAWQTFPQPMWDGRKLKGERVLIVPEQGLGDAIQFVRYAPKIVQLGGEVIVQCDPCLAELFQTANGVARFVATNEPLPTFDFYLPMLSQPFVFQTTAKTIPSEVPYLFVRPEHRPISLRRPAGASSLKIGVTWSGNAENIRNSGRRIPFDSLRPIFGVEGVTFYSLQLGPEGRVLQENPEGWPLYDHIGEIHNFADTATVIMELDLIISVDTAVAHLAGALGKPVWTLLPFVPDWRWGLEGETTSWYPTMRLFRQPRLGDWDSVIHRVKEELELLMS